MTTKEMSLEEQLAQFKAAYRHLEIGLTAFDNSELSDYELGQIYAEFPITLREEIRLRSRSHCDVGLGIWDYVRDCEIYGDEPQLSQYARALLIIGLIEK